MKNFTNQSYGSHAGRMNNGRGKFRRIALFPLMLLMLLLLPTNMVAQTITEEFVTLKELAGNPVGYQNETYANLFDGKKEDGNFSKWCCNFSGSAYVIFEASKAGVPVGYTITTGNDNANSGCGGRNPLSWKLYGNNEGKDGAWTLIQEVSNDATLQDKNYTSYNFTCKCSTSYQYFKWEITAIHSGTTLQVGEFELKLNTCSHKKDDGSSALGEVETVEPTCTEHGYTTQECSICHFIVKKYLNDKLKPHTLTHYEERNGIVEYWQCDVCHNCFSDANATQEIIACANAVFDDATKTLTFSYGPKPEEAYDLNKESASPAWNAINNSIEKVVFHSSFAKVRPTTCKNWFENCIELTQIEGMENLNTEKLTDMSYMFYNCRKLSSLDFSKFNTENVTNMRYMFYQCRKLSSLDLSKFNTENVTNMRYMFNDCWELSSLDLSKFNTKNVTDMECMFESCSKLSSLDLSNFNTAKVKVMSDMFRNCNALTTIYVRDEFVTEEVYNSQNMFLGCINLKGAIDKYDESKIHHRYANYKTGYFTNLAGKNGDEKIGAVGEILTAENLTLNDDKDFVAYEPFAAKAASYNRTMKEGTTWATLCLPFEVSLANQNFRAFKLLSADNVTETVELEEIKTSIAAGTPVIIKMNEGATKLSISEADKEIANEVKTAETSNGNYQLQGLYTQKMFSKDTDNNCYIVKGDKLMNPAKLLDKTKTESVGSKPFRAYMVDNSSAPAAGARMFSISVGGSTTAIEQLETTADSKAEYYDLQGRRLQNLQKGINIVKRGGKTMKVIIK